MITDLFFSNRKTQSPKAECTKYVYIFVCYNSEHRLWGKKSVIKFFFLKPLYYQPAITKILCILPTSPSQVPNWEPLLYTYFFIYKHTRNYFIICFNYYLHDKIGFTLNHKRETVQIVNSASDEKSTAQKCV